MALSLPYPGAIRRDHGWKPEIFALLTATLTIARIRQQGSCFAAGLLAARVAIAFRRGEPELLYGGCDLGVVSAKAAIIDENGPLAFELLPYSSYPQEAAVAVMEKARGRVGLAGRGMDRCVSTGFGGQAVPYSNGVAPDTVCLQRAIAKLNPRVRTVINVGGHSFVAFHINHTGGLGESAITDLCTAGMGMFMEVISTTLEMPLDQLTGLSRSSANPLYIDNQCPIFAESEVISLINDGHDKHDVFAGVIAAVANKIAGQVRRLGVVQEVAMVGGVAKNGSVVGMLERRLGLRFADLGGIDPQLVAALGAALLAREGCSFDSGSLSSMAAERLRLEGRS